MENPVAQGSAEWLQMRIGKITASRMGDVLATLKRGGEAAARRDYRLDLIAERLTGRSENHYVSPEMEWGTEMEPIARAAYEIGCNAMIEEVGFIHHPNMPFSGGSPDGLVDDDGLIEIKCGKTTTHLRWMSAGVVPAEHRAQMMWNLACTGRKYAEFVSFDPRLPDGAKIFIVRMGRDEKVIGEMEYEVEKFNAEIESEISRLGVSRPIHRPATPVDTRTDLEQLIEMIDQRELVP